jgi:hypothetical protein
MSGGLGTCVGWKGLLKNEALSLPSAVTSQH